MKCIVCNAGIIGQYVRDEWGNAAHVYHHPEEMAICSSCGRLIGGDKASLGRIADGRHICQVCKKSEVKDIAVIEWIERQVRKMLEGVGFCDIPSQVPITIVEAEKMASFYNSSVFNPQQKGLTLTQTQVSLFTTTMAHQIYILDHLPKVEFAGVLAHELLHAWQNQLQIKLPAAICEGVCNLGSYVVYTSIGSEMAQVLLKQLEKNPDSIYGDGYRKAKKYLDRLGWEKLILKICGNKNK